MDQCLPAGSVWVHAFFKFECYKVTSMSEVPQRNSVYIEKGMSAELISQQQELILVLKQEIMRLQEQLHSAALAKFNADNELRNAYQTIDFLNEKVRNISDNNEALMRTVQVFQREFIKRDSSGALGALSVDRNGTGQFHLEVIRNLKSKLSNTLIEPSQRDSERSPFADYYGFFLQDETVEEGAISLYNEIVEERRIRASKIRSLGKRSYFHEKFRHVFWFNSIENRQRITKKLYGQLVEQLEDNLENKPPRNSIIDLDLRRMDLKLDEDKSRRVAAEVKRLLQLFELYRPDIRYVQGMSYLAWIFLIRLNPYCSFVCFCNLVLNDSFVHALYMFDEPKIRRVVAYFDECLADKRPKLHRHLHASGVDSELFLIQWAYTLYSRAFSLRIVAKIWDLWFSEGYNTFFKVAMTVFQLLESELMDKQDTDRLIDTIRTSCYKIEEAQFLKVLGKQKLFEDLKLE